MPETRRHARDLAPFAAQMLSSRGWSARDLDAVAVSHGPGSYTGLRVGIMSAKTLAYVTGCTLLAIDTFTAIARQSPADAHAVEVLADAQQQRIYHRRFQRIEGVWQPSGPLTITTIADWLARLPPGDWVSGPGAALVKSRLSDANRIVTEPACEASAASLLAIALERWHLGDADDVSSVEPLYLRPSNAEENWAARGGSPGAKR